MKNKKLFLLFLFALFIVATGKILPNNNPSTTDVTIIEYSIDYNFSAADSLLNIYANNQSLKSHFLYLSVELMKIEKAADDVGYDEKREFKEVENNKLIEYAENVIEKYEDDELNIENKFYLASIYGYLGRFYGTQRSWMSAFSNGKVGRNLMLEILEEDSTYYDAYLLVGMLNYYADRLGGITEFVASILGLSGDRDIGLEYLKKAVEKGKYNNWQAAIVLMEIYSRMEGNKYEAIPLLEKLVQKFPHNSKFTNWLAFEYLNTYQFNKLASLIESDSQNRINKFIKARYYYGISNYNLSNDYLNQLFNEKNKMWPGVYENAKFLYALNNLLLGNLKEAESTRLKLNDNYRTYLSNFQDHIDEIKSTEKFRIALWLNDSENVNQWLNDNNIDSYSNFVKSRINYHLGVFYLNNRNFIKAEDHLLAAKSLAPNEFGREAAGNLIYVYLNENTSTEKVENLLDYIDDLDSESLEYFSQDLIKKYDL